MFTAFDRGLYTEAAAPLCRLRMYGPAAGLAGCSPALSHVHSQEMLSAGAWWEVAFEGHRAATHLCAWLVLTGPLLPAEGS